MDHSTSLHLCLPVYERQSRIKGMSKKSPRSGSQGSINMLPEEEMGSLARVVPKMTTKMNTTIP